MVLQHSDWLYLLHVIKYTQTYWATGTSSTPSFAAMKVIVCPVTIGCFRNSFICFSAKKIVLKIQITRLNGIPVAKKL